MTFGSAAPNATVCISNITKVVDVSLEFGKHISNYSNSSWLQASSDFQEIFETIHPIFYSCYRSAFEFYNVALFYGETFTDWHNIVYNLIHNIGFLYDSIYFLVIHHIDGAEELEELPEGEQSNWWYKLGIYYGNILYRLLYTAPPDGALPTEVSALDPLADLIGVRPSWFEDLTPPEEIIDTEVDLTEDEVTEDATDEAADAADDAADATDDSG